MVQSLVYFEFLLNAQTLSLFVVLFLFACLCVYLFVCLRWTGALARTDGSMALLPGPAPLAANEARGGRCRKQRQTLKLRSLRASPGQSFKPRQGPQRRARKATRARAAIRTREAARSRASARTLMMMMLMLMMTISFLELL